MKKKFIKASTFILALIMIIGIIPFGMFSASAETFVSPSSTARSMRAFSGDSADLLGQNIYFGVYDGASVKWRVLGNGTTGTNSLLMLSEHVLIEAPLDSPIYSGDLLVRRGTNKWDETDAKAWCDDFETESLTEAELNATLQTRLNEGEYTIKEIRSSSNNLLQEQVTFKPFGDYTENVFFLSVEEVEKYMPVSTSRSAFTTGGESLDWWTRSGVDYPVEDTDPYITFGAGFVNSVSGEDMGLISDLGVGADYRGYRPAFNLNASNILFISAPSADANPDFDPITEYSGNEWVLTLGDGKAFEGTSYSGTTALPHGYTQQSITVNHKSLANMGGGYNRVTAMLTDSSGNIVCYGKINTSTSATQSTVQIPEGLPADNYKLSIRAEYWDGRTNSTRVATSNAYEISISVQTEQKFTAPASEPIIQLGTAAISGYNSTNGYDTVVLGSNGDRYLVLDTKTNMGTDGLFLFANDVIGTDKFGSDNVWESSNAKAWLTDYASTVLSSTEAGALIATTKTDGTMDFDTYDILAGGLSGDKIFLISAEEISSAAYGFDTAARRVGASENMYWLRSPAKIDFGNMSMSSIVANGDEDFGNVAPRSYTETAGMRPAMNFDSSKVLFTLAADGSAQRAFGYIPSASNQSWKLTLGTGKSPGTISFDSRSFLPGATVTVTHSPLSGEYNTFTAMLVDKDGKAVCYGSLTPKNGSSTESTLQLPSDIAKGYYSLYIYAETWNDGSTNYASNHVSIGIDIVDRSISFNGGSSVSVSYTGAEIQLPTADELTLVNVEYDELIFSWTPLGEYQLTDGKPINAGEYNLKITAPVNGSFSPFSLNVRYEISKINIGDENKLVAVHITPSSQYSIDIPSIPEGGQLGTPQYTADIFDGAVSINGSKLELTTNANVSADAVYTVKIPVTGCQNYNDYEITLTLTGKDKLALTGTPSVDIDTLVYGQKISDVNISGKASYNGTEVVGAYSWATPEAAPSAGIYEAEWIFTPEDTVTYDVLRGKVNITVQKATVTGGVTYNKVHSAGKTLADASLAYDGSGDVANMSGDASVKWELDPTTLIEPNVAYKWILTPASGAENFNAITGTAVLWEHAEHTYGEDNKCTACGEEKALPPTNADVPQDNTAAPNGNASDNASAPNGNSSGNTANTTSVPAPVALSSCGSSVSGMSLVILVAVMACALAIAKKEKES